LGRFFIAVEPLHARALRKIIQNLFLVSPPTGGENFPYPPNFGQRPKFGGQKKPGDAINRISTKTTFHGRNPHDFCIFAPNLITTL
jgi:hypothetical protein